MKIMFDFVPKIEEIVAPSFVRYCIKSIIKVWVAQYKLILDTEVGLHALFLVPSEILFQRFHYDFKKS